MDEVEVWLARDRNDRLNGYSDDKPIKYKKEGFWDNNAAVFNLPKSYFPNIQWSDKEPTKAKIILTK